MALNDVGKERLQEVEIKGHYGLFTDSRVDKSRIPEGIYCYELRHGDNDSYPTAKNAVNLHVNILNDLQ